ncbi:MAG: hypothetical protein LC791_15950, partial [Acidobacteria bacterium]|nr:hypothetical protein [Acidobacteriota bacterium]
SRLLLFSDRRKDGKNEELSDVTNLSTKSDQGHLSRDGSWSVFMDPAVPLFELARSCRNNQVRRTTVGAILKAGGRIRESSGPPHHHDLYGLTPQEFDAILGVPEPNPVPRPDRWKPS